jgi:Ca-activated chloride channel family protein
VSDLFSQLELTHPGRLFALLALPLLAVAVYRGAVTAPTWQRVATVLVRALLIGLLIAAFADLRRRGSTGNRFVVLVTDQSDSIDKADRELTKKFIDDTIAAKGDHQAFVLPFAAKPGTLDAGQREFKEDASGSNPALAVSLAAATIPADYVGDIVLLTDGVQIGGDLLAAAKAAGLPVSVVPLTANGTSPVRIMSARILHNGSPSPSPQIPAGEKYTLELVVESRKAQSVEVVAGISSQPTASGTKQPVDLVAGDNLVRLALRRSTNSRDAIQVGVRAADNTMLAKFGTVAYGQPPTKLLLITDNESKHQPLIEALQRKHFEVATYSPGEVTGTPGRFDRFAAVLLGGIAGKPSENAGALSDDALRELQHYTRDGGGVIAFGAAASFAPSVYADTQLEELLPVMALERIEEKDKTLALALAIDTSKSMEIERRMELARQAAARTIDLLSEADKVGVVTFNTTANWVIPIARCGDAKNKTRLKEKIAAIKESGLTNMYPALERAYLALEQTDADRRHVILLTDGVPSPGDFDRLARKMAASRITVSTVSVGKGADQSILQDIARLAQGEHQHCDDPNELRRFFESETRSAVESTKLDTVRPFVLRSIPGMPEGSMPQLPTYAPTSPKPGAELLMIAAEGDPLLAWRRYGAGVAAVFTSDPVVHAGSWSEFDQFWAALARLAARGEDAPSATIRTRVENGVLRVSIDLIDEELLFVRDAAPQAILEMIAGEATVAAGSKVEEKMPETAPGRYTATFDCEPESLYEVRVAFTDQHGKTTELRRAVFTPPTEEHVSAATNVELLKQVVEATGGKYNPRPGDVFEADDRRVDHVTPLWPYFVMAAIIVFLVDVGLRQIRSPPTPPRNGEAASGDKI